MYHRGRRCPIVCSWCDRDGQHALGCWYVHRSSYLLKKMFPYRWYGHRHYWQVLNLHRFLLNWSFSLQWVVGYEDCSSRGFHRLTSRLVLRASMSVGLPLKCGSGVSYICSWVINLRSKHRLLGMRLSSASFSKWSYSVWPVHIIHFMRHCVWFSLFSTAPLILSPTYLLRLRLCCLHESEAVVILLVLLCLYVIGLQMMYHPIHLTRVFLIIAIFICHI